MDRASRARGLRCESITRRGAEPRRRSAHSSGLKSPGAPTTPYSAAHERRDVRDRVTRVAMRFRVLLQLLLRPRRHVSGRIRLAPVTAHTHGATRSCAQLADARRPPFGGSPDSGRMTPEYGGDAPRVAQRSRVAREVHRSRAKCVERGVDVEVDEVRWILPCSLGARWRVECGRGTADSPLFAWRSMARCVKVEARIGENLFCFLGRRVQRGVRWAGVVVNSSLGASQVTGTRYSWRGFSRRNAGQNERP